MSTEKWTDPNNRTKKYNIGTIGWEYKKDSVLGKAMSLALSAAELGGRP